MRAVFLALWERPIWLLWLPPAFWAGNLVLGRALGPVFPPVSLAVGRWAVALAVLAPFVWRQVWRERALLAPHWLLVTACGAFGVAGYNALGYLALQTVPATSVAFLNSTLPLVVPLVAVVLGVERITWKVLLGIVVSFVGVLWIAARGDMSNLGAMRFDGGALLVLLAVVNYAVYSVLLRRKPAAISPLVFLAATMATGLLVLLPFWVFELSRGAHIPTDLASVGAVLYIGVFASLFAFILWSRCVATLGATVTGVSFHLVAIFTALLAFLVLGESVRAFHVAGIALILAGFFATTLERAGHATPPSQP
ncbi:MAG: DMT family transporter [Pseudacidovorax sp.]|nr:DMT family transporter [Pseudacidovorax sp.]